MVPGAEGANVLFAPGTYRGDVRLCRELLPPGFTNAETRQTSLKNVIYIINAIPVTGPKFGHRIIGVLKALAVPETLDFILLGESGLGEGKDEFPLHVF